MDEGDFTKARSILFPRNVVLGHGVLERVPNVCKEFGLSGTALIVTGSKTKDVAAGIVGSTLQDSGFDVQTALVGEATQENLDKVEEIAREVKTDFLLGPGGSKIDLAKMVAKDLDWFISYDSGIARRHRSGGAIKKRDGPCPDPRPAGLIAYTADHREAPTALAAGAPTSFPHPA